MKRNKCTYTFLCLILVSSFFFQVKASPRIDTVAWITHLDSVVPIALELYEQEVYAIRLSKRSSRLKKLYYGDKSSSYLQSLLHLSALYSDRLQPLVAQKYHRLAYDPYMAKLRSEFCYLSENDRAIYWKTASSYFDKTMRVAYAGAHNHRFDDGNAMAASAYNAQLLSKGLLLNLSIDFENYVLNSGVNSAIELFSLRKQYIDQGLQSAVDSLDYQILRLLDSEGVSYHIENLSTTWETVQNALGPNDLAIEFFEVDDSRYGALLLKKNWKHPKIIRLPSFYSLSKKNVITNLNIRIGRKNRLKNSIDFKTVLSYFNSIISRCEKNNEWSDVVRRMVFPDALLQYFPDPGTGRIFFSASGVLHQTAIESIPFISYYDDNGVSHSAMMSDVFNMVRLSSTREILGFDSHHSIDNSIVYGGIDYNADFEDLYVEHQKYPMSSSRGVLYNYESATVDYLPFTETEANSIHTILTDNHITDSLFTSTRANEESFKFLSGRNNNIIHVGTHGFYWPAQTGKIYSTNSLTYDFSFSDDPLNRCGLLFAGANITLSGRASQLPSGIQDGILTAKEISLLNLQACDLVILSACETASGDITSEGVFGLQRAFKKAGVNTIVMSLWNVNDMATQLLMTEFYHNWIERGQSKREAFKNAQNSVRFKQDQEGNFIFSSPYYWSGFIMLD